MGCQQSQIIPIHSNSETLMPIASADQTMTRPSKQQNPPQNSKKDSPIQHPQNLQQISSYKIPHLEKIIKKAFSDLNSKDPMAKRLYLNQVLNYILSWLPKQMERGSTLFDSEKIVRQDLERACKEYPIAEVQKIQSTVPNIGNKPFPNLFADIKNKTKQTFTDRVKQLCLRSIQVSYEFNKQMQLILQKDGGYKFITGYKFTGTKAYLRIMTKILDQFLSQEQQSKQVYNDLNHYYYTPVFNYFNTIIDQNITQIKIGLYDWIRCKCSYRNIQDLERAFKRLQTIHGKNIFRVKNRINQNTRDILINLKFKTEYTEIQLALAYDDLTYEFQHKLYELTRQKLGVAYSCFTFMLSDSSTSHHVSSSGVMTSLGYLKKSLLREKIEPGFERLTLVDAQKIRQDVKKILGKWIVALKTGYADGSNPQKLFSQELYGPEVEDMFVIKKRSDNLIKNWLNWMD